MLEPEAEGGDKQRGHHSHAHQHNDSSPRLCCPIRWGTAAHSGLQVSIQKVLEELTQKPCSYARIGDVINCSASTECGVGGVSLGSKRGWVVRADQEPSKGRGNHKARWDS